MSERYILNKADKYAYITPTNVVEKTEQKEQATVFTSQEATAMLKRAHKKLNGFTMIPLASLSWVLQKNQKGKMTYPEKDFQQRFATMSMNGHRENVPFVANL